MRTQTVRLVMLVMLLIPIVSACMMVTPAPAPAPTETPAPTEALAEAEAPMPSAEVSTADIHWLIHDGFRFEGDGLVLYTDPYLLSGEESVADLILITHDHGDHCSPDDVAHIQDAQTVIVTTEACAAKLSGNIQVVAPGDEVEVKGIPIQAVPAYNIDKFRSEGVLYHPPEAGNVGFIFTMGGQRIYHAGDTDNISEMSAVDVDIALLPVSGKYVMTADEAVEAAGVIKTRLAIPMHIGRTPESLVEAEAFKANATVPVEILPLGE